MARRAKKDKLTYLEFEAKVMVKLSKPKQLRPGRPGPLKPGARITDLVPKCQEINAKSGKPCRRAAVKSGRFCRTHHGYEDVGTPEALFKLAGIEARSRVGRAAKSQPKRHPAKLRRTVAAILAEIGHGHFSPKITDEACDAYATEDAGASWRSFIARLARTTARTTARKAEGPYIQQGERQKKGGHTETIIEIPTHTEARSATEGTAT